MTDFQNGDDQFDLCAVAGIDDIGDLTIIDNGATVTVELRSRKLHHRESRATQASSTPAISCSDGRCRFPPRGRDRREARSRPAAPATVD